MSLYAHNVFLCAHVWAMIHVVMRVGLVEHRGATKVASLPDHHRDPFDRLLIAIAQTDRMTILTSDRQFQPMMSRSFSRE
jgi:PIN domain nuclease of toxin-antitoxin system